MTKLQTTIILALILFKLVACAPPSTFVSTTTIIPQTSSLTPIPSTITSTLQPTQVATPTSTSIQIDTREDLSPDTYIGYWNQGSWYIKGINGSNSIQLMENISSEIFRADIQISPNGNLIAFSNKKGQLSVYDLRTGKLTSYTQPNVNSIYQFVWLPDSNTILYLATPEEFQIPDSHIGIYGFSLRTEKIFTIIDWENKNFEYGLRGITMAKNGQWLAFYAPRLSEMMAPDPNYAIYLMNMNCLVIPETCSENIQLIGNGASPTWSPDGKLGWDCSNEVKSMLCFIDINKPKEVQALLNISQITSSSKISFADFSWSPDGKHIAITLAKPLENNAANDILTYIVIASPGTNRITEVTLPSDDKSWVEAWSPNSKYLIYSRFLGLTEPYGEVGARGPISDLYLYDLQNGEEIDLVDNTQDTEIFGFFMNIK